MEKKHPQLGTILVSLCVLIAVNNLSVGNIIPSIALYARSFDVLQWAIGLAVGISGVARLVFTIPTGSMANKFGRTKALAFGGLVAAFGNLLCAYSPNYPIFLFARFVAGIGSGMIVTAGQIVLVDITNSENRGRVMSIHRAISTFALGIGPYPGGFLAAHYGLKAPFLFSVVAGGIASIVAWFLVPETYIFGKNLLADKNEKLPFKSQVKILFSQKGFALVTAIGLLISAARAGGFSSLVPILGSDRLSLTTEQIGFCIAVSSVVGLLLTYPSGVLVDRYGHKFAIVPAMVLAGLSLFLFAFVPSYPWFMAGCVVWTAAISISGLAPIAYAANLAPAGMNAAAVSSFHLFADIGYLLGPVGIGLMADYWGVNFALFAIALIIAAGGIVFGIRAPGKKKEISFSDFMKEQVFEGFKSSLPEGASIISTEQVQYSTDSGYVSNLVKNKQVGHFLFEVTWKQKNQMQKTKLLVKSKSSGKTVLEKLSNMYAHAHPLVGQTYAACKKTIDPLTVHAPKREIEIYNFPQSQLKQMMPKIYKTWESPKQDSFLVVMEYLENVSHFEILNDTTIWKREHIEAALRDLAEGHSAFLNKTQELEKLPFMTSFEAPQELLNYWGALIVFLQDKYSQLYTKDRIKMMQQMLNGFAESEKILLASPKTLVHGDMNPKNICLRNTPAGKHLCAYDWEFSVINVPQIDLCEILTWILPPDTTLESRNHYIEFYRKHLEQFSGTSLPKQEFFETHKHAAYLYALWKLARYSATDYYVEKKLVFWPRLVNAHFNYLFSISEAKQKAA